VATTSQRPIMIWAINLKVDIKWRSQETQQEVPDILLLYLHKVLMCQDHW